MTKDSFVKAGFDLALQVLYHRASLDYPYYFVKCDLPDLKEAMVIAGGNLEDQGGYEPLASIFNVFGKRSNETDKFYDVMALPEDDNFVYAHSDNGKKFCKDDYVQLVQNFKNENAGRDWSTISSNEILKIWQQFTCLVPAEDGVGKMHDVSLYMRTKMTAAIAAALARAEDKENEFLMISGDISGIQDFIYTIPSKGALKSLRGRSFYLEVFMENFIDELLDELDLTRANLLYVGGGHFYILIGNNGELRQRIKNLKNKCNQWFLKNYGTKLYIAIGYVECTRECLRNGEKQSEVFYLLSEVLNVEKLHRYDVDTLRNLFDHLSDYNKNLDSSRECSICHSSVSELHKSAFFETMVCSNCEGLLRLGAKLIDEDCLFVVGTESDNSSLAIFGSGGECFLHVLTHQELKAYNGSIKRIYTKHGSKIQVADGQELNLVDYSVRDANDKVKDFSELADASISETKGIKRLAVLRADVDNLGAAFLAGFSGIGTQNYSNLTRYADLSNALAVFFKRAVDKICEGQLPKGQVPFYLFGHNSGKRQIHVVYSGGDDMFFVGAWEDLIELVIDIREAFRIFTNDKLTFSAGLAIFHHSYPISKMAEQTGYLESMGKELPGKNSVALFGMETEQKGKENIECKHRYSWTDFVDGVCVEKLRYLFTTLTFTGEEGKIKIGKGQLYKIINLIESASVNSINLARFAYLLGRLQPRVNKDNNILLLKLYDDFTKKLYSWFCSEKDRKELHTAITLLVYYLRDREKED